MRYKIRVILDNDNDEDVFKDFEVSKNINLTKFHEYIKKEFNLQGCEMASFYSVDENWDTLIEYTLVPFDDNSVPMEKLSLHEILNNNDFYINNLLIKTSHKEFPPKNLCIIDFEV